jgi:hypothetical protein
MREEQRPTYRAFLVRFWQEGDTVWRGTVEDPHTGQRHAFADIEPLLDFLRQQVRPESSSGNSNP